VADVADEDESSIPQPDLERANVSRMYDYFLGGSHNFAVDRELAQQVIAASPEMVPAIRELRSFMRRAVMLCLDRGIDQFLDLGSGIPTVGNVHEVARRQVPDARVAYVDHEAVAVHHSREILRGLDGVSITQADLRDADVVLSAPTVTGVLDLDRPIAVLMLGLLHFLPQDPATIVAPYRAVMAPGSALAINHTSADWDDPALAATMRARVEVYRHSAQPATLRGRDEIAALFAGMELAEPGLVDIARWRPDASSPGQPAGLYGAVGFLPGGPADPVGPAGPV
jgi:O-methyltransferase involved in polyketide biosynthesis